MKTIKKRYIVIFIVALLVLDQAVKLLVKCNMTLGESIHVFGNWFQIYFVENPGAAFGWALRGAYGKLILSLFRVVAVGLIGWYVWRLRQRGAPTGVIMGVSLALAGAIGNIIDSAFYGLIFSESTYTTVATLFPAGGSYEGFLHGKVVDMLYFPLFTIHNVPEWLGWLTGGDGEFTFFSPVFNVADSYITIAVFYLVLFQWRYYK